MSTLDIIDLVDLPSGWCSDGFSAECSERVRYHFDRLLLEYNLKEYGFQRIFRYGDRIVQNGLYGDDIRNSVYLWVQGAIGDSHRSVRDEYYNDNNPLMFLKTGEKFIQKRWIVEISTWNENITDGTFRYRFSGIDWLSFSVNIHRLQ